MKQPNPHTLWKRSTGTMRNACKLGCISIIFCLAPRAFSAVSYPYLIPGPVSATLDVNTSIRVPIDSMQLCVNYDPYDDEGLKGLNGPNHKAQFRAIKPSGVRWPQGIWSNFYDWESDGRRIFDTYQDTYYGAVVGAPQLKYGFNGLHELHDELNFDVLFTWNICYDSVEKGMARYNDRVSKGFDFRWIELGNENFYKDQRSDAILDPQNYPPIARAHSQALKAADPEILISVPAAWKTFPIPQSFTDAVAVDQSYYDAVSVHKYMSGETLDAVGEMESAVNYIKGVYPGKPIWMTEWSVNASGDNALGVLGTADIYLYFFNRMDEITMNENFQVFGGGNFYDRDYNKTSFGACYDIIRSVFADSDMFENSCTSTEIASGINAVYAEAVNKDGEIVVFALNKSTNDAPFTLRFNGENYAAAVKHETLAFSDANEFKLFGFSEDPLTTVSPATAQIVLPPLSLNVISGFAPLPAVRSSVEIEAEEAVGQINLSPFSMERDIGGPTYLVVPNGVGNANYNQVASDQGIASYSFEVMEAGDISLEVLARVPIYSDDSFWHRIDGGSWVQHDAQSGNSWKWITLEQDVSLASGMHTFEIARREDGAQLDRFRLTSINGTLTDNRSTMVPSLGTTRIEAEDYDEGGDGVGYHDRTPGNAGSVYRADDVDLGVCSDEGGGVQVESLQAGEWLQYPIHVQAAGMYEIAVRAACTNAAGSAFRVLFDDENKTGTLVVPDTGSLDSWTDTVAMVELAAGKQMMRLKWTGDGGAVNHIELTPYMLPIPWEQSDVGAVAAQGSTRYESGTFALNASGSDIWNTADEFHFAYRPVQGDCEIIARVDSLENTNPWAKAGVMIREALDTGSIYAATLVSAGNGIQSQARLATDGVTSSQNTSGAAPYWLKINRTGNTFTYSHSTDGVNWMMQGSPEFISMNAIAYIGLAATSHSDGILGAAVFSQVSTSIALTANAGADQLVLDDDLDGFAFVSLNGSASFQGDNDILSSIWREGDVVIATGENATVVLEAGLHVLSLTLDDGTATDVDEVIISVEAGGSGLGPVGIIAGWDQWTPTGGPASVENGAVGSATESGWNTEFRAGSSDGTFGTFAGADPTAGSTNTYGYTGIRHPNMTSGAIDFTITETAGVDIELSAFHFDSVCRGTTPSWTLDVLSGDISTGVVANGTVDSSYAVNTLSDYDVNLSGLADSTLDAFGTVTFRLSFASATAKHLELDNVGLSGSQTQVISGGYPDSNTNGIPDYWEMHYLGALGLDVNGDEDFDGLSNYGEFVAGTHPTNALSTLIAKSMVMEPGGVTLTWDSVNGRTYNVLKKPDLVSNPPSHGSGGTSDWNSVSGDLPGTGAELDFTDSAATGTNTFYKIQVTRP